MEAKHVTCDYCSQPAPLVTGRELYPHRPDLWEKKFYRCTPCDAHVGCHPPADGPRGGVGDGTVPMGRLANAELRRAKTAAHAVFDPFWQAARMRRRDAYLWLAQELGVEPAKCHIGMFDVDQCQAVIAAVHRQQVNATEARRPRLSTLPARRTGGKAPPPHCGCDVLPWDDCTHTRSA